MTKEELEFKKLESMFPPFPVVAHQVKAQHDQVKVQPSEQPNFQLEQDGNFVPY